MSTPNIPDQSPLFTQEGEDYINWNTPPPPLREGIDYVGVGKRQEKLLDAFWHLGQMATRTGFSNRYHRSEGDREVVHGEYTRRQSRGPASPAIVRDVIVPGAEAIRADHYQKATESFMEVVGTDDAEEAEELWKALRADHAGIGKTTKLRNEYIKKLKIAQKAQKATSRSEEDLAA